MDSARLEALVLRLVHNPHDEAAIAEAHAEGQVDPKSYASLLEKVGAATSDPALASYWLTEAANVWIAALGDAHRAARTLMLAIERDPLQPAPAERLADLYRQKGDNKALAALLERRTKALLPMAAVDVPIREQLATIFEELGRLWTDPPLSNPEKAVEHFRKAMEYDPGSEFAVYSLRELFKTRGALNEALPLYETERALTQDPERKLALFVDEGEVRQRLLDWAGAIEAFRRALSLEPKDPATRQQLATVVLEQARAAQASGKGAPGAAQIDEAAGLFVGLAEEFGGEHGFLYALCALELAPGLDRAIDLALSCGEPLGRLAEASAQGAAYLQAKPNGKAAPAARRLAAAGQPQATASAASVAAAPASAGAVSIGIDVDVAIEESRPQERSLKPQAPEKPKQTVEASPTPAAVAPREATPQPAVAKPKSEPQQAVPAAAPAAAVAPAAAPQSPLEALLSQAVSLAAKNRKNEAYKYYREALDLSPAEPEALAFVDTHLKRVRKFAELRDLLWAASNAAGPGEPGTSWLREVASLCETQLRDIDGAIRAWQKIHESDPELGRTELHRLLTQTSRWDDLAAVLVAWADQTADTEARIAIEKELATLHETKRHDVAAAAVCWARIAALDSGNEDALWRAIGLFERAGQLDAAASTISANVQAVADPAEKAKLYQKLGTVKEAMGDLLAAGEALREGALESRNDSLWEAAEDYFVRAQAWEQAAAVVRERAQALEGKAQAAFLAREAGYVLNLADRAAAVALLERASDLDPESAEIAARLEHLFTEVGQNRELVAYLLRRAEASGDKELRINLRRRAAGLQRDLGDRDGARESLELSLKDREDAGVLSELATEAEERGEADRAVDYCKRLADITADPSEKAQMILRQARLLIDPLGELEGAVDCFRAILENIDPHNREALSRLAEVELQRGEFQSGATALESLLKLAEGKDERLEVARRLADLYDNQLGQDQDLMRVLALVHDLDADDFEAIGKLSHLAEKLEDWKHYVDYQRELIAVEGDEEELSRMTLRLSDVLQHKLEQPEEALKSLLQVADLGDAPCREAFVQLGDELGKKAEVAERLVAWHRESPGSPQRTRALHDAFDRFAEAGKDLEATQVARELARTRAADPAIAERLEGIATRLRDLDALAIAHGLSVRNLSGMARVEEMVRQSEVLVKAGVVPAEAVLHGEQALTGIEPGEVEPLLVRLSKLVSSAPENVVDLYERQVARCKGPEDRLRALGRAAQVAAEQGLLPRAGGFFELALSAGAEGETLEVLERAARETDEANSNQKLMTVLAESLAAGGQGVRDAGRTRATLLRRAGSMALYDLNDSERAFQWIGDSLIAHVADETLEALVDMGRSQGDFKRVETVLSRALEEVTDGPLVRKLLGTRGRLRRDELSDVRGSAEDLKRLHDLAPADTDVISELSALYTALEDYRGMVQLYEDQILRSKDQTLRADLSREVALLWRDRLKDARETADAWRRVLRLRAGDAEATEGLTAAKQAMLKQRTETATKPAVEEAASTAAESPAKEPAQIDSAGADAAGADSVGAGSTEEAPVVEEPVKIQAVASDEASNDVSDQVTNPPPANTDDDAMSAAVTVPPKSAEAAGDESDVALTIPPKGKGKGKGKSKKDKDDDVPLDD